MAVTGGVWRDILDHHRTAADNREPAYAHKLMYGCQAAHYCLIFNSYMPGERAVIGKNTVISHYTIVGNMRIGHKEVVITDEGLAAFLCPRIKGAVFTNDIVIAYV